MESLPPSDRQIIEDGPADKLVGELELCVGIAQPRRYQPSLFRLFHQLNELVGLHARRGFEQREGKRPTDHRRSSENPPGFFANAREPAPDDEPQTVRQVKFGLLDNFQRRYI